MFYSTDKYEWGQITSRFLMGSAIITISVINVNANEKVLSDDFYLQGSRIWWLATHYWVYEASHGLQNWMSLLIYDAGCLLMLWQC